LRRISVLTVMAKSARRNFSASDTAHGVEGEEVGAGVVAEVGDVAAPALSADEHVEDLFVDGGGDLLFEEGQILFLLVGDAGGDAGGLALEEDVDGYDGGIGGGVDGYPGGAAVADGDVDLAAGEEGVGDDDEAVGEFVEEDGEGAGLAGVEVAGEPGPAEDGGTGELCGVAALAGQVAGQVGLDFAVGLAGGVPVAGREGVGAVADGEGGAAGAFEAGV
jgi:hypothetical protein